jgi:hypothetical protein
VFAVKIHVENWQRYGDNAEQNTEKRVKNIRSRAKIKMITVHEAANRNNCIHLIAVTQNVVPKNCLLKLFGKLTNPTYFHFRNTDSKKGEQRDCEEQ